MRFRIISSTDTASLDALIVPVIGDETPASLPRTLRAQVERLLAEAGPLRPYATLTHLPGRPSRVIVVGLGPREQLSAERVRNASATGIRALWRTKAKRAAIVIDDQVSDALGDDAAVAATAEGAVYSMWRPETHRSHPEPLPPLGTVGLLARAVPARAVRHGAALGEASNFARRLANEPANLMTPEDMAREARALAEEAGLGVEILDEARSRALGMHSYLSVAQGSDQPPRFIVLRYHGRPGPDAGFDLALVGKSITFDSGGISIKPSANMHEMKADMMGGALVIAAIGAIAKLRPRTNVIAIAPAAENLPGPRATKPGDVFTSMSGKTIEVLDTDAEGRLTLIDAVTYAQRQGARRVVDVATLTTGTHVALGGHYSAIFGTPAFVATVRAVAERVGDRLWPLPLSDEFRDDVRSEIADLRNTAGRFGGASKAAAFIEAAVEPGTEWVHLDIAGAEWIDRDRPYSPRGVQTPVLRTLVQLGLEEGARPALG